MQQTRQEPKHSARLSTKYFDLIIQGKKTVEGRLNKPPLNTLQVHDTLRLFDREDEKRFIDVEVLEVKIYQSFRQMLEEEGIEHCLPSVSSIDDGCAIYHQFPGYEQGAKTMGVLAIRITLLPQK